MKKQLLLLVFVLGIFTPKVESSEFTMLVGGMKLPATNYRYLNYGMELGFGSGKDRWILSGGLAHPNEFKGYSENTYFGSINYEWNFSKSAFSPFVSFGFGGYINKVGDSGNFIPSYIARGGLKIGGRGGGIKIGASTYMGIYNLFHWTSFVIWDLVNIFGGLYFSI